MGFLIDAVVIAVSVLAVFGPGEAEARSSLIIWLRLFIRTKFAMTTVAGCTSYARVSSSVVDGGVDSQA